MRKILVTGGWGFIGSHIVEKLLDLKYEVVVLDRKSPNQYFLHNIDKVEWIRDSISNIKNYNLDVEGVFHLAGKANVKESVDFPYEDMNSNLISTFQLLEWAKTQELRRFIFSSSVSVIGSNILSPVKEDAACMPISPYGASKSASENYCNAYFNTFNIPTIVCRLFNVYGPVQSSLFFSDIVLKLFENNQTIELWGGGEQIRDYLHIRDLVDGLVLLFENGENGKVYNLASGKPVKLKSIALQLANIINGNTPNIINNQETYVGDIETWYADVSEIRKLDFIPKIDINAGIKETARWYLENKEWLLSVKRNLK